MADDKNGRSYPMADELQAQWDAQAETVSLSTSSNPCAAAYSEGTYLLLSTADVFLKSGPQASVTAATNNFGLFLKAGTYARWRVNSADNNGIAGILSSGTGSLYIMKPAGVQS